MKRALAILVVLAVALAVAAFTVPQNAASVNGEGVSQTSVNSDLVAIAHSDEFQCYLDSRIVLQTSGQVTALPIYGVSSSQSEPKAFDPRFVGYWLGQRINGVMLEQMAAARHLTITPADLAFGRADLEDTITATIGDLSGTQYARCSATGDQVLASLPSDFVNELVETQAAGDAVEASSAGYALSVGALAAYFSAHRTRFDTLCVSAIQTQTKAEAATYRAQILAGTPFSQIAKTLGSTTGGTLGCFSPSNSQFPGVQSLAGSVATGKVSQPISYRGVYVLLEVTKRTPNSFETAASSVRAAVLAAGATKAGLSLESKVRRSDVSVDPAYGRYVPASTVVVAPPPSPPVRAVLNPSANVASQPSGTPAAAGLGGAG